MFETTCSSCLGSGNHQNHYKNEYTCDIYMPCSNCNGTGKVKLERIVPSEIVRGGELPQQLPPSTPMPIQAPVDIPELSKFTFDSIWFKKELIEETIQLLRNMEHSIYAYTGYETKGYICPWCNTEEPEHTKYCRLKEALTKLEKEMDGYEFAKGSANGSANERRVEE